MVRRSVRLLTAPYSPATFPSPLCQSGFRLVHVATTAPRFRSCAARAAQAPRRATHLVVSAHGGRKARGVGRASLRSTNGAVALALGSRRARYTRTPNTSRTPTPHRHMTFDTHPPRPRGGRAGAPHQHITYRQNARRHGRYGTHGCGQGASRREGRGQRRTEPFRTRRRQHSTQQERSRDAWAQGRCPARCAAAEYSRRPVDAHAHTHNACTKHASGSSWSCDRVMKVATGAARDHHQEGSSEPPLHS